MENWKIGMINKAIDIYLKEKFNYKETIQPLAMVFGSYKNQEFVLKEMVNLNYKDEKTKQFSNNSIYYKAVKNPENECILLIHECWIVSYDGHLRYPDKKPSENPEKISGISCVIIDFKTKQSISTTIPIFNENYIELKKIPAWNQVSLSQDFININIAEETIH